MSCYLKVIASFFCFLINVSNVVKAVPLAVGCGTEESDIAYQQSVKGVLNSLYETTSASGFSVRNSGNLYGYALCRGDVSSEDCLGCVDEAINEIQAHCPTSKAATIYYDYCYLLYQLDRYSYDSNILYCQSGIIQPTDQDAFVGWLFGLFSTLVPLTLLEPKYFAAGSLSLDGEEALLYGYVQCFNDLAVENCIACLQDLLNVTQSSCTGGYIGGRLVGGTCLLRYESYNFLSK